MTPTDADDSDPRDDGVPDGAPDGADNAAPVAFPDNPVLATFTRGDGVESFHRGAAIVLDADGAVRLAWGDVERPVFARSALKPVQALALLETAPESPLLTDERVALHTASHSGWPQHTERIASWLTDLGLSATDLACGDQDGPMDPRAGLALAAAGGTPSALHHNCSGQHAGFLMLAGLLGVPLARYDAPDHPVQRIVTAILGEMTDLDPNALPWGVEGCGVPSPAVPLWALALGAARLADPTGLPPVRAKAAIRLRRAMATHPELIAGPGRSDTLVAQATGGRILSKIGAEGVVMALLPDAGLGVAVKIDDGAARAADLALGAVLETVGALDDSTRAALTGLFQPTLTNAAGHSVGHGLPVRPVETDSEDDEGPDPWDWEDDEAPNGYRGGN